MEIILNKEAPLELVRIIDQLGKDTECVNKVIVDAFIPALAKKKAIGAYEPISKTVLIDLGNCLTDGLWMKYGMLYIPCVWLNTLVAVYHEFAHACQIANAPDIADIEEDDELYQIVEEEAMADAMEHALTYFQAGSKTPPLREMGWLGKQVAKALNGVFHAIPLQVAEELEALKSGAVADVMTATAALPRFTEDSIRLLKENVDSNQGGVKIESKYYMTMAEFIAAAGN